MTLSTYIVGLIFVACVAAVDYYIEPSPTAPRLCTLARPCTIGLLPSLTTADTVHFLGATTGTSNTYSFGTRTINGASVIIDSSAITFFSSVLQNTFSESFTFNSARYSGGSLVTRGVQSVSVTNANFTNGAYIVLDGNTVGVSNSVFSGLNGVSNSVRHIIYGVTVDALKLQFSNSRSTGHFLSFQPSVTFTSGLAVNANELAFTNCNTTGASSSIMTIQTSGGRSINAGGISDLVFTNCYSRSALYLARCNFQSNVPDFSIISSLSGMIVTSGGVLNGLISLESASPQATIEHSTEGLYAVGVDFGSKAVYVISNAGSAVIQNNILGGSNTVCDASNLNYIASCTSVNGAPVYLDYAYVRGTYANVSISPFDGCTNTTLDVMSECWLGAR